MPTVTNAAAAIDEVSRIFGRPAAAAVGEEKGGVYTVCYREGRDATVIARGKSWDEALGVARDRVQRVDQMLRAQPAMSNPTVATAASVPVRFVRLRRRDLGATG